MGLNEGKETQPIGTHGLGPNQDLCSGYKEVKYKKLRISFLLLLIFLLFYFSTNQSTNHPREPEHRS